MNYKEIVKVEGLDCIQTGRNDISSALGIPGQEFDPRVIDMEDRIVGAALEAGKQVALTYPGTAEYDERIGRLIEVGVRIFSVDQDFQRDAALLRPGARPARGPRPRHQRSKGRVGDSQSP